MRIGIFFASIILAGIGAGVGQENRIPAVAVLADSASRADAIVLVAALEARLSADKGVRLLERAQIDKVLAEQRRSITGLTERDDIISTGRLLRADAFVLLSVENGRGQTGQAKGNLVRVRVAETAHGLRLWEGYEALETSRLDAAADRIAEKIRAVVGKIIQPGGSLLPVGIVDIHRVQLPQRYEPLARVLPGLLSARLGKEPRVIMLERESLGTLLREKQLAEGPEVAFWSSAVLIDGYLQPGAHQNIDMSLRLRRTGGEELSSFQVRVDPNGLVRTVDEAATQVLKVLLNGAPAARWDPAREADEFFRQGVLLLVHGRQSPARTCLEAAHALQPDNLTYTEALFSASLPPRGASSGPVEPADTSARTELELAELASLLARQMRDGYERGELPARDQQVELGPAALHSYFGRSISVATDEVRLINRRTRRIWFETAEKILADRTTQNGDLTNARGRVQLAWASSEDPEEVMATLRERLHRAILPPEMGGTLASNDSRCVCCEQELYGAAHFRLSRLAETNLSGSAERFTALWNAYVKELTESRDPMVKFFALATEVYRLGWAPGDRDSTAIVESCRRAVDVLLNELHSPNEPLDDSPKRRVRRTLTDCLEMASGLDANEVAGLWERIYTPLVDAGDAHNLALWDVGRKPGPYQKREAFGRYRKLLDRIDEVYAQSDRDPQVTGARAVLRDGLRRRQPLRGGSVSSPDARGPRVTMLLRKEDWPREDGAPRENPYLWAQGSYMQTTIQGDMLWVGFFFLQSSAPTPSSNALVGLDLSWRQVRAVWWTGLPSPYPLSAFVVRSDRSYLAVPQMGIVTLPGADVSGREIIRQPSLLTEANGLPSVSITSIADAGARLWVAYGGWRRESAERESGLGLYDPASGAWERVFSSAQRGEPPFSGGRPYFLNHLAPAQDKLFFFTSRTSLPRQETTSDGLWRMDVATRALMYLGFGGLSDSGHVVMDGTRCLFADRSSLVEFDLGTEKARLVCGDTWWLTQNPQLCSQRLEVERAGGVGESPNRKFTYGPSVFGRVDLSGAAVHEKRVWAPLGESQVVVIPAGGTEGEVVTLDNTLLEGGPVLRFMSTPYGLIGIGHGTAGIIDTRSWSGNGR
jgi:hypothetical protein